MNNDKHAIGKGLATIGICVLGGFSMYVSGGSTGIGWAILGVLLIWG
jgi:hypothetical protein